MLRPSYLYIEELKDHLRSQYPRLRNTSDSTICRVLNFDLQLTRKKLTKAAREAVPKEKHTYKRHLDKYKDKHQI